MPIGKVVRRLLGSKFRPVGEAYRSIFVDMDRIVDVMVEHIAPDARLLDVGGGDGYVVNLLLERMPGIRVTMTDLAAEIGSFIEPRHMGRVTLLPATDVREAGRDFDVITIADVVHHVPRQGRVAFFASIAEIARGRVLIVKDLEPGHLRSYASLASDWYVTGDKGVSLVSMKEMEAYLRTSLGGVDLTIVMPDRPNYVVVARPLA